MIREVCEREKVREVCEREKVREECEREETVGVYKVKDREWCTERNVKARIGKGRVYRQEKCNARIGR
jgi:predicted transcriptional regulator